MNIRNLAIVLGSAILLITTLFIFQVIELAAKSDDLKLIEHNRYLMVDKSNELRQSSDDLTQFALTYVITGNNHYKETYFKVLDIRNGQAPRPDNYSSIYWEVSEPVRTKRHPLGEPSSLKQEMSRLPFLPYEFEKLEESELNSNDLVTLEIEAFNAMDGLFKNADGLYTIKGGSNQELAIKLLTSNNYRLAKEKIMMPIDDFLHSFSERINQAVIHQNNQIQKIFENMLFLFLIGLVLFVITAFSIKRRILSPILYLTNVISSFNSKNTRINEKISFNDEIGEMTTDFFKMKHLMDDDIKRLHFAFTAGHQGWFDFNPQTGGISVSDEYAELLGYKPEEFNSDLDEWKSNIHPDDLEGVLESVVECIAADCPVEYEYRRKNKQGSWLWLHSVGEVVERDSENKATRVLGVLTNITDRKQHEFSDNIRSYVFELLAKTTPIDEILEAIIKLIQFADPNLNCNFLLIEPRTGKFKVGASPNLKKFHDEIINVIDPSDDNTWSLFTKQRQIFENINEDKLWIPFTELANREKISSCCSEPILGTDDAFLGSFIIYNEKSQTPSENDLKLMEFISQLIAMAIERSRLNEQVSLSARVFMDTHEGITITDPKGIIVDVNPAFNIITGYSREEAIGRNPSFLSSGKQPKEFYNEMWNSINNYGYWQGEVWNRKKNGELYAELLSISALNDDEGNVRHYVGLFSDITRSKVQREKLNLMAHYDVLTQLPNRTLLSDRFNQAIAHSKRSQTQLAVCFLDLDNFKPINDNFGHDIGDKILIEVAKRIIASVREEDTVSRQGGDEFALLLSNLNSYDECKQTIKRIHHALSQPYLIEGYQHEITASTGITLYPDDDGDIDTLLRHADQAMYQAKVAGKHRYQLFNTKQDQQTIHKHSQLEEIRLALENDEFVLYYQPKVNMKTGKVFGMEALIRWMHPEKGLIPPLDFLPIIEATGLEIKLGNWVINKALKQLSRWKEQGVNLEISVNIASYHLQSSSFVGNLKELLQRYSNVSPSDLQLEILESSALTDIHSIGEIIKSCREELGVNVALDDFGTGYSSLTHLRNLTANTIKIDQTFIRGLLEDPSDYAIVNGIIGLADSFDREIIAEGVETTEHGLLLMLMGCDEAQGYGISRPMPANKVFTWLKNYQPNNQWLEHGNINRVLKERKLEIFRITTTQWKDQFVNNLKSLEKNILSWPIMDKTQCPCGTWIRRAQQEQLFAKDWLLKLDIIHNQLHAIASELLMKYQDGDMEEANKGINELQNTFDDMWDILELA